MAEDRNLALGRIEQAFEDFDGRGLACSVWAQQPKAFARLNCEIQPAHGFDFAVVGFAQVTALDGDHHVGILT